MTAGSWLTHHVRAIMLVIGGLCALGVVAIVKLPVAIFPDLAVPRIIIAAEGSDAPAQNVLVSVTKPLEEAFTSLPGLKLETSQTTRGSVGFFLTFVDGTDMAATLPLVQARIDSVRASLPAGTTVTAERLNPTVFPIIDYSLTSDKRSLAELKDLALYTLRPRIARVPGVFKVLVNGGERREFHVQISPDRLAKFGIAVSQVDDALSKANSVTAVGSYDEKYIRQLVIVSSALTDIASIERTVVGAKNRIPVTVGQIADVSEGIERKTVIATGHGHEAVLLNIVRTPDGNTIQVADGVRAEVAKLQAELPGDIQLTPFYDQSEIVRESESSVVEAIAVGSVLALIVVATFLRNTRAAFVTLVMLPVTLLITFAALRLLHMTLHILTLGGIAIALGLVIDDAIVVVEHIFVRLEEGHTRFAAIRTGVREISPALVGSSFATIVTFAPLLLLPGVTGGFFAPLALTLIATLIVSLGLSVTLVPILAHAIFPREVAVAAEKRTPVLERVYGGVARWTLRYRWVPILLLIPLVAVVYGLYGKLETGFMPEFDEGAFVLDYRMPAGTSLEETDRALRLVEHILAGTEGVSTWSRLTGASSGSGLEITPLNQGDLLVKLKAGARPPSDDIMADVRLKVSAAVPNLNIDLAPILGDLIGDLAGSPSPIEVKIFGPDIHELKRLAGKIGGDVSKVHGIVDEADGITDSGPETMVEVDPINAAINGLTTDSVAAAAQSALDGDVATFVKKADVLEPVRVQYPVQINRTLAEIEDLPIASPAGQLVRLGSVARVYVDPGLPELDRENQRLMDSVTARLDSIDLGTAVKDVKAKLKGVALPPGYSIEYGGLYKSQQESFAALGAVLATAAASVFVVMVIALRSFRIALSLFLAAICSLSGVIIALYATATPLNVSSYTGAIMIVGIVTENGILLFSEFRRRTAELPDLTPLAALEAAGRSRLRPILMTTVAAIAALFPLALGIGAGAAMQKPLAIAVIGGLAFSTMFTMLLAPALYATMLGRKASQATGS
ncbi:MAG: efflux RND transporter permease subunit [Fimbriimonadaceae bacterium]